MPQSVIFKINKNDVMAKVAITTGYAGSKLIGEDEDAYERIFTTEADEAGLERFYSEAKNSIANLFRGRLQTISETQSTSDGTATVDLEFKCSMPSNFDGTALEGTLQNEIENYMTSYITAMWFKFTNKQESSDYLSYAAASLQKIQSMFFCVKRPTRNHLNNTI